MDLLFGKKTLIGVHEFSLPDGAHAWSCAISLGRFFKPQHFMPSAIAPELTSTG